MKANFSEEGLNLAVNEIIKRNKKGYNQVIGKITLQIKDFYKKNSSGGKLLVGFRRKR